MSESYVSRLLSGDRTPSLEVILKIRDVLDWAVEDQAWTLQRDPDLYGVRLRVKMEATEVSTGG